MTNGRRPAVRRGRATAAARPAGRLSSRRRSPRRGAGRGGSAPPGPGCGRGARRARRRRTPARAPATMTAPDLAHLVRAEAAGGERRRADADARGHHRRPLVEGHRVLVDRDAGLVQAVLGVLAGERGGRQVDEHQVVVGAAGDQVDAARAEHLGQDLALLDDLPHARRGTPSVRAWPNATALAGDHVHQRAALQVGEHGAVDRVPIVLGLAEDEPGRAARAASCGSWW